MALTDKLTSIANAIREKTGSTEKLSLEGMADAIAAISAGGGGVSLTSGTVTPASNISSLTIEHGLGTTPKFFILMIAPGNWSSKSPCVPIIMYDTAQYLNHYSNSISPVAEMFGGDVALSVTGDTAKLITVSETAVYINLTADGSSAYLRGSKMHSWMAIA